MIKSKEVRLFILFSEKDEQIESLKKAICKLSPEQREVFLLREDSHLTFKQIAKSLEIPIGTALARMHKAIKKLRILIKREQYV